MMKNKMKFIIYLLIVFFNSCSNDDDRDYVSSEMRLQVEQLKADIIAHPTDESNIAE